MRLSLILAAVLLLASCVGSGSAPIVVQPVVSQTTEGSIDVVIGPLTIGGFAWNLPVKVVGEGSYTLQYPTQPHILLDGVFVWEPVYPEQAPAIQAAIARGEVCVRNAGRPVALSAPGTIR